MKVITLIAVFVCASVQLNAQTLNAVYDSVLAKKLNADQYGMKKYYLVLLKSGSNVITDKKQLDSIFGGHMKNIQWLASKNQLVVAGPMEENNKNYRGIFILNTNSKSVAEKMLETDPAIHSKVLEAEYYSWYGSAALQQTTDIHNKIAKDHF